jgi:hypothetical protein
MGKEPLEARRKIHQCSLEDGNRSESPKLHADDDGESDILYFNKP